MLIFLPVFLLIVAAGLIIIIDRVKKRFGLSWLIASVTSLVVWLLVLVFRFRNLDTVFSLGWLPAGSASMIRFQLDETAWQYCFAMGCLLAGVTLSAPLRYRMTSSAWGLAANMLFTAACMTSVMSGTPITLALCWSVIDIMEALIIRWSAKGPDIGRQTALAFAVRVTGTYCFFWAISAAPAADFSRISPNVEIFLLLAAGLRLGIIPLRLPDLHSDLTRGLGTIIRMTGLVSSFVFLGRLPAMSISQEWTVVVIGFCSIAAVYGGLMWLTASDEVAGRPFLLVAVSGLVTTCVVRGNPAAGMTWGTAVIFFTGLLLMYSAWDRRVLILLLFCLLGFTGLPFTPTMQGWTGLVDMPIDFLDILIIVAHALILSGFVGKLFTPRENLNLEENWKRLMYGLGLFLLASGQWLIFFINDALSIPEPSWIGFVSIGITAVGFTLVRQMDIWLPGTVHSFRSWSVFFKRRMTFFNGLVQFNWLYIFIGGLYRVVGKGLQLQVELIEGDGGIIWILVILALVISLLTA